VAAGAVFLEQLGTVHAAVLGNGGWCENGGAREHENGTRSGPQQSDQPHNIPALQP
jgi:hypothetical protein